MINNTKNMVNQIIDEIETTQEKCQSDEKKSVDEVMKLILGRNAVSEKHTSEAESPVQELKKWRDKNNQIYAVNVDHLLHSNRPAIGQVIVLVKKVIRKLIHPIIIPIVADQNEFNASVTASINAIYNNAITMSDYVQNLQKSNEQLLARIKKLERKENRPTTVDENVYDLIDFDKFEKHFRGSREEIREAQKMYLPYFKKGETVIDLGCGRGEFLELLKENDIHAVGVEPYPDFANECKGKRLEVVETDAISFLEKLEDFSIDGIFAAQLIEHLKPADLVRLCRLAYKKIKKGGCIIMETPNPTCLAVYTNAFYLDPTHEKPVHPKTLEYYLQDAGFQSTETIFTENSRINYRLPLLNIAGVENLEEINNGINLLSDTIFGSQNYAMIAKK